MLCLSEIIVGEPKRLNDPASGLFSGKPIEWMAGEGLPDRHPGRD
jgi:hypothetical protein